MEMRASKQRKEPRLVPDNGQHLISITSGVASSHKLLCGHIVVCLFVLFQMPSLTLMTSTSCLVSSMYRLGERLLEDKMQVCRKSRVRKLGGTIIVVNKVDAARGCVPDLPAWRQRAKLLAVYVAQVSE